MSGFVLRVLLAFFALMSVPALLRCAEMKNPLSEPIELKLHFPYYER